MVVNRLTAGNNVSHQVSRWQGLMIRKALWNFPHVSVPVQACCRVDHLNVLLSEAVAPV